VKIDLLSLEGPLPFAETVTVEPERLESELVAAPMTVRLEGEVRPYGEFFSVFGKSAVEGSLSCSRCLEEGSWQDSDAFTVRYRVAPVAPGGDEEVGLEEEDLEVVFVGDGELDLAELAAEQILLGLPMRWVCDESCRGLCPQCGANRNQENACTCEPETDPRWQALADLANVNKS
jgi:uncharacterized protein